MKRRFLLVTLLAIALVPARADNAPVKTRAQAETLVATLNFREGTVPLKGRLATLNVPSDMRFLDGPDAAKVVYQLWGNRPGPEPLGMLVPADCSMTSSECWGVIITYEEDGYVRDDDAQKINYDKLLKEMQAGVAKENKERERAGYDTFELVGWAARPRYDAATHKMYWAKNLRVSDGRENTLNYNIRILGRQGVLVLNAVAAMSQLPEIEQSTPKVLAAIDFNAGNRYADFNASSGDKVATYGIAALVAGGVAAKAGLFKGIWIALLAGKKFVIIAIAAIGTWIRKLTGRAKAAPPATSA